MNRHSAFALEVFFPYRLNRLAENVSREFSKIYRDRYAMTRPEWRSFASIGQNGETTATDIVRHSAMHKTKVSRAIAALEERRWITRKTSTDDKRVELLTLTAEGRAIFAELSQRAMEFERLMFAGFSEEETSGIINCLGRLESHFASPL